MCMRLGQRAVVIGAGIGGLSVAGALAAHFDRVDVLERDRLAPFGGARSGTPQDRHPHGLLAGGLRALDEIFPGFEGELARAGAVPIRVAEDLCYERPDVGRLPQRRFDRSLLCASRPLIEHVLRRRAEALANVRLWPGCRVTEFVPTPSGAAVCGVRFEGGSGWSETLEAELVVDATGRGVLTSALLEAVGQAQPEVTVVGVDILYSTALVRIPADAPRNWKLVLTLPNPPVLALNGVLVPTEDGHWLVTIADRGAPAPLASWEAFLEALGRLNTPTLHDALRHAEPPASLRHFRFPASLWRHYERLAGLPRGLLPVADALCRFNPIYGQGMSAAAQQARLLQKAAAGAAAAPDPIAALQAGFMAEVASLIETPWNLSTSADLAFPATRAERPKDFEERRRFEAALFRAVVADPIVHRAMLDVTQLLRPASDLQEPDMLRRIEAASATAAA